MKRRFFVKILPGLAAAPTIAVALAAPKPGWCAVNALEALDNVIPVHRPSCMVQLTGRFTKAEFTDLCQIPGDPFASVQEEVDMHLKGWNEYFEQKKIENE